MSHLILINGAPASGKSTLARRYADDHPLTLVLDIDEVRSMLGRWLDQPTEAGLIARKMAIEMARVHLTSGRDVLVPQLLGKLPFVHDLERLCVEAGARFIEVALLSSSDEAVDRFVRRSQRAELSTHRDAKALLDQSEDAISALHDYYAGVLEVISNRPSTHTIRTIDGLVDEAYGELLACVNR